MVRYENMVIWPLLWRPWLPAIRAVIIWMRKSNWFCMAALRDWLVLKRIRGTILFKQKWNRDSSAHFFSRLASATCNYFKLCFVLWICVWLGRVISLLWFCYAQLKTALMVISVFIWFLVIQCRDPGTPENGIRTVHRGFYYSGYVIYQCNRKYRLDGASRIYCLRYGNWTKPKPRCLGQ